MASNDHRQPAAPPGPPRCPGCGAVDFDVCIRGSGRLDGDSLDQHAMAYCGDCGAILGFFQATITGP